ncbi:hypothetical protein CCYA_CCYA03G0934 [Cyanidiococcus yangmingshanensis]|nr:hypothetical protein CCYA_CCYA03G0934 [Cyanidiococcus yangmingshanensis]
MSSPDSALNVWELEQTERSYQVRRSWIEFSPDTDHERGSSRPVLLAGVDVAWNREPLTAALCLPGKRIDLEEYPTRHVPPYYSSFLAYREAPLVVPLVQRHRRDFDVLLVDGNGILHPRRYGLASAIGVECGVRTIGVAKSYHWFANTGLSMLPNVPALLTLDPSLGRIRDPPWHGELYYRNEHEIRSVMEAENRLVLPLCMRWYPKRAETSHTPAQSLSNRLNRDSPVPDFVDEVLGAAVRTGRRARNPVYVSVGHGIDLDTAVTLVQAAAREHRLPEPLRLADQVARGTQPRTMSFPLPSP